MNVYEYHNSALLQHINEPAAYMQEDSGGIKSYCSCGFGMSYWPGRQLRNFRENTAADSCRR